MSSSWSDTAPFSANFLGLKIYVPAVIMFAGLGLLAAAVETIKFIVLGVLLCNAVCYFNDARLKRWSRIQLERPAIVVPLVVLAYEPFSLIFLSYFLPSFLDQLVYAYGEWRAIRLCFEQAFQLVVVAEK